MTLSNGNYGSPRTTLFAKFPKQLQRNVNQPNQ